MNRLINNADPILAKQNARDCVKAETRAAIIPSSPSYNVGGDKDTTGRIVHENNSISKFSLYTPSACGFFYDVDEVLTR